MNKEEIKKALADIVGDKYVTTDPVDLAAYGRDRAYFASGSPRYGHPPDFVVLPKTTEEVAKIARLANEHKIVMVPLSAGTNVVGAAIPHYGGILIDLRRMNKILEINKRGQYVVVQPGVRNLDLMDELLKHGFMHGTNPGSAPSCSMAGSFALEAVSLINLKYGNTPANIMSLEVVTPTGEIFRTPNAPSITGGYNLNQLFARSEGTLGIITELTVKVHPAPEHHTKHAIAFPSLKESMPCMDAILGKGFRDIDTCTVWDRGRGGHFIKLEGFDAYDSFMMLGFEGIKEVIEVEDRLAMEIVKEYKGVEMPLQVAEDWWESYHIEFTQLYKDLKEPRPKFTTEIVSVMPDHYEEVIEATRAAAENNGFKFIGFKRLPTWLSMAWWWDPRSDKDIEAYKQTLREVGAVVAKYGGTLTGCHGAGTKQIELMEMEYGPTGIEVMRKIKKALDPNNIMNPGKIFTAEA